jgi:hypothetical protein
MATIDFLFDINTKNSEDFQSQMRAVVEEHFPHFCDVVPLDFPNMAMLEDEIPQHLGPDAVTVDRCDADKTKFTINTDCRWTFFGFLVFFKDVDDMLYVQMKM